MFWLYGLLVVYIYCFCNGFLYGYVVLLDWCLLSYPPVIFWLMIIVPVGLGNYISIHFGNFLIDIIIHFGKFVKCFLEKFLFVLWLFRTFLLLCLYRICYHVGYLPECYFESNFLYYLIRILS